MQTNQDKVQLPGGFVAKPTAKLNGIRGYVCTVRIGLCCKRGLG